MTNPPTTPSDRDGAPTQRAREAFITYEDFDGAFAERVRAGDHDQTAGLQIFARFEAETLALALSTPPAASAGWRDQVARIIQEEVFVREAGPFSTLEGAGDAALRICALATAPTTEPAPAQAPSLLPCPCCASTDIVPPPKHWLDGVVYCRTCGLRADSPKTWNTRQSLASVAGGVDQAGEREEATGVYLDVAKRLVREWRPDGYPAKEREIARMLVRHFLPHPTTPEKAAEGEVTQADRNRAADWMVDGEGLVEAYRERIKRGDWDNTPIVRLLADHRLAALAQPAAPATYAGQGNLETGAEKSENDGQRAGKSEAAAAGWREAHARLRAKISGETNDEVTVHHIRIGDLRTLLTTAQPAALSSPVRQGWNEETAKLRSALQDVANAEAIPNDAVAFVWCRDVARQALASTPSTIGKGAGDE